MVSQQLIELIGVSAKLRISQALCQPPNKQLERTVTRRRAGRVVTRPLNCGVAPDRWLAYARRGRPHTMRVSQGI